MRVFRRKKSKKSGKGGGVFFVKKWTFPQRRVHYVQYQYFYILHFTYFGVYAPNATGLKTIRARRATAMRLHLKSLWPLKLILAPQ